MPDGLYQRPAGSLDPVRVVVIDDHELILDALARVLADHPGIDLVGVAGTVEDGVALAEREQPDLAIVDFRLPDGTGVTATGQLRDRVPGVEVIMMTGYADGALLARALEAGCSGFVSKGGSFSELIAVIDAVSRGEVRVPSELLDGLVRQLRPREPRVEVGLTAREREVLQLLAAGRSTTEMVDELTVSVHTVRNHVRNLLQKLDASSRLEAVAVATRLGLVRTGA